MASIEEVYAIIHRIKEGFKSECSECLKENSNVVEGLIREQIYSGQNGKGRLLRPTYDNDPFFEDKGHWYHRSKQYKKWKEKITPPIASEVLFLSPRPIEVPNLYITGKFHDSITATASADGLNIFTRGFKSGNDIVSKYGDDIFMLGDAGRKYFAERILLPHLVGFIRNCGYK